MNLAIGIIMVFLGLMVSLITYFNIKIKKKFSLIWGGFNLISLSIILITIGIFVIAK